jgi:hypothetical protein
MEILLAVLGVIGCIAMMGIVMMFLPPVARRVKRNPRFQGLASRLRSQSAIIASSPGPRTSGPTSEGRLHLMAR